MFIIKMKLILTEEPIQDQILALQREVVAYSWMLGLFALTILAFTPILIKVIQTQHDKDPIFMSMLIILQLTLVSYLYSFGYFIAQFRTEISLQ